MAMKLRYQENPFCWALGFLKTFCIISQFIKFHQLYSEKNQIYVFFSKTFWLGGKAKTGLHAYIQGKTGNEGSRLEIMEGAKYLVSKNLGLNPRLNQLCCCCSVAKSCPTVCDPMYSAR